MISGALQLRPGGAPPTVSGHRPLLVPRIAPGRRADELPDLLGALFTLCSHAQRGTARRAVAAARGDDALSTPAQRQALRVATAREQMLRIAHDWPRLLPEASAADPEPTTSPLRSCPLWRDDWPVEQRLAGLPGWLAQHWLGLPLESWLQRYEAEPEAWPLQWCRTVATPTALLLRAQAGALRRLATPARPLRLLDQPLATVPRLARQLAERSDFCTAPDWLGEPAETGPWTRINDPVPLTLHNAWMRLIARLVDVLRLAMPAGDRWLAEGALPLASGEGIAWTETARGLLVHRVELAPDGRVRAAQVLAPTEWNFHPRGVLAQALAALRGPDRAAQAARAAVAFDPCVEFVVAAEAAHA
ncbi:MAG: nickel-dependent hydrogenase large subunit [Piscinibacter sp.]|nr:nickel-dependent hydrogenase large subunit [Piscinibacter sp.]